MMATRRETRSSTRQSFPPPEAKDKENHKTRAKRHQSMGGAAALETPSIPFKELVIKPKPELSPGKKRRRSAVPRKSILRRRGNNDDETMEYTLSGATAPLPAAESQDFTTIMNFESHTTDDRRKSLARRVSFASHAHVRLFPKDAAKGESSSPAPSTPSETAVAPDDPTSPSPPAARGVSFGNVEDSPDDSGPSSGPSIGPRRRSSIANAGALLGHDADEDDSDDSSMEIDDDNTNASIQQDARTAPVSPGRRVSLAESNASGADMDITAAFGGVQQRGQDDTAEHTASSQSSAGSQFLYPLGKNVPAANPKSRRSSVPTARDQAWAALESVTNGVDNESTDEEDMELAEATGRIQALRRASVMTTGSAMSVDDDDMVTGKILQTQAASRLSLVSQGSNMELDDEDDDSRTDEEPTDHDDGDRTVNLSTMMSRISEMDQAQAAGSDHTDEDSVTSDPPLPDETTNGLPALIFTSPTKTTKQVSPSKAAVGSKRPSSEEDRTPTKRQAVGDTPTKATLRAIQPPPSSSKIFPSPLRQSPGRILRMTPSKLGSPSRVRLESPLKFAAPKSPGRLMLAPVREEDTGSSEDSTLTPKSKGRAALASIPSAPMPASQSQSVLQGLEDISGIMEQDGEQREGLPLRQLGIDEFLELTGVTFMDGLAVKRRSTIGPGVLNSVREENLDGRSTNRPVSEYVSAAAVGIPQLEMYIWACQELKKNIATSQETVLNFDEQVEKNNPLLFREYMAANEEERPLIEGQLKIMKAHARLCAKEKWYQWRHGLVQDLQSTVNEHLTNLQADYDYIYQAQTQLDNSLPELRARAAALAQQLATEQSNIQELEGDNPEQLKELREGIAEQNTQIEAFRTDIAEVVTKTERLEDKIADIEEQRRQQLAIIAKAEQHCQMLRSCTRSEVFRLKEDYESLQRMHLWIPRKIGKERSVFVYDARIEVILMASRKLVGLDGLRLLAGPKDEDPITQRVFEALFSVMQQGVKSLPAKDTQRVLQAVDTAWTAATHLLAEIHLLNQKYPMIVVPYNSASPSVFTFGVDMILQDSKVQLTFAVDTDMLMSWPSSASALQCNARLVYGEGVDMPSFLHAARTRIGQATQDLFYGYLVGACAEALASQE